MPQPRAAPCRLPFLHCAMRAFFSQRVRAVCAKGAVPVVWQRAQMEIEDSS